MFPKLQNLTRTYYDVAENQKDELTKEALTSVLNSSTRMYNVHCDMMICDKDYFDRKNILQKRTKTRWIIQNFKKELKSSRRVTKRFVKKT